MTIEDDVQNPVAADKALEETWDKLRPDDPANPAGDEDEEDQEQATDDSVDIAEEDLTPLDGEMMGEPVDTIGPDDDVTGKSRTDEQRRRGHDSPGRESF